MTADKSIELQIKLTFMNTEISKKIFRFPTVKEKFEGVDELKKKLADLERNFKQIICIKDQEIRELKEKNDEIMR